MINKLYRRFIVWRALRFYGIEVVFVDDMERAVPSESLPLDKPNSSKDCINVTPSPKYEVIQ